MECKKCRDYGHMVFDYYFEVLQEIREDRKRKLKEIKTRKQAEKYQEYILSVIKKVFPLPDRKTPLNAKITGILEKPGYRIEKVLFESRPDFFVTGNFYVPSILKEKTPGVLVPCGHSATGKAYSYYQEVCLRLVKSGFIVFIYDPMSQGERDQYFHLEQNSPLRNNCCSAHNMIGKQLELIGEFFGAWRVWDGIRALDYLLSRTEVDIKRVGLTGCSGGGTLTTWLWAIDERFTMAAPSCFVTTFFANLENELPSDNEQCPPGILASGLEQADFFMVRAPKPVILLGEKYDSFDVRGLKETHGELKNFYRIFNAEKDVKLFIDNNVHGYFPEQQKEMIRFFCKYTEKKPNKNEVSHLVEKDENLWVTKTGQVVAEGSKPAYKIISEKAKKITENRKNIKKEIEEEVKKQRRIIETYIKKHPEFYLSFSPVDVESEEEIIKLMSISSKLTKTGPMASVAGGISEVIGKKFLSVSEQIFIENGGDIFMNLKNEVKIGIYAGSSPFSMKIGIKIKKDGPYGIATSSGTVGHSFSYGDADAVTIISSSATFADGAATYFGNLIKGKIDKEVIEKEIENFPFVDGILIIRGKELFVWGNMELVKF